MWPREGARAESKILVVNGHPDPRPERFCAALCAAYLDGARAAGRNPGHVALGTLPADERPEGEHAEVLAALDSLGACDKLVAVFPLWLDKPPPLLTWFFELAAFRQGVERPAHLVVTMAMPAFVHRSFCRSQMVTAPFDARISLPGWQPSAVDFIGSIHALSQGQREEWLSQLRKAGSRGT